MTCPVIAIGLDSAEHTLVQRWMREGRLPTLARLWNEGLHAELDNFAVYSAELPWTTFLTGSVPERTGYWTPILYDARTYSVRQRGGYGFDHVPPFYALGPDWKVAVFDVPQSVISDRVSGVQALAWGAHSPQTPRASSPPGLMDELIARHGDHPAFLDDNLEPWETGREGPFLEKMLTGIRRRGEICADLMRRDRWNLFLTVFGEPHSAGHALWHRSDPAHPLYEPPADGVDPVLQVHEEVDRACARILEAAPADARVLLFSVHGMEGNSMDLPSMFFLPELMYRYSTGRAAFAEGTPGAPLPEPRSLLRDRHWAAEVYARKVDANPLRRLARRHARFDYTWEIEKRLGWGGGPAHPNHYDDLRFIPAMWYANCWPEMRAFALPSFADGYVRINLKGREANGIVDPADYDRTCEDIARTIRELVNPRNGRPIARTVHRTRANPLPDDPTLAEADLVVEWDPVPADVADHPVHGRIGPVPYRRTGSHTSEGFAVIAGPGIPHGSLPKGHGTDMAPTILHLMGAPVPNSLDGVSLLNRPEPEPLRGAAE